MLGVSFRGEAIPWRHSRDRGSDGRCHGNNFWLSIYGVHIMRPSSSMEGANSVMSNIAPRSENRCVPWKLCSINEMKFLWPLVIFLTIPDNWTQWGTSYINEAVCCKPFSRHGLRWQWRGYHIIKACRSPAFFVRLHQIRWQYRRIVHCVFYIFLYFSLLQNDGTLSCSLERKLVNFGIGDTLRKSA